MRALVLSGGGVKGVAHVAFLERMGELDADFDLVVGTSAGAIVGALHCLYLEPSKMKEVLFSAIEEFLPNFTERFRNKWGVVGVLEGLIHRSLVTLDEYYPFFRMLFGKKKFSDCKIEFVVTVFNIESSETDVIDEGYLVDAALSSSSVPGFFEPNWLGGYPVLDGGVLSNVPVSIARKLGADYVLVSAFKLKRQPLEDIVLNIASVEDYVRDTMIQNMELSEADDYFLHEVSVDWDDFSSYFEVYRESKESLKNWMPSSYRKGNS